MWQNISDVEFRSYFVLIFEWFVYFVVYNQCLCSCQTFIKQRVFKHHEPKTNFKAEVAVFI